MTYTSVNAIKNEIIHPDIVTGGLILSNNSNYLLMREGDFIFLWACGKKKIDEHFMLACSRGAYQKFLLRKSGRGAYRGGGA